MNTTDRLIKAMLETELEARKGRVSWAAAMDLALAVESALNRREIPIQWDGRGARVLMRQVSERAKANCPALTAWVMS